MPIEDKFAVLYPKMIKFTIFGSFIVVVDYPDKPESDSFTLGWRGTSYFETYEELSEMRADMEAEAIVDMENRRTRTGYYFRVKDVQFREEITHEYT